MTLRDDLKARVKLMKHKNNDEYFEPTAWQIIAKCVADNVDGMGCWALIAFLVSLIFFGYLLTMEMIMSGGC